MRHEAQREGQLGARRGAIDAWERGLLANRMLTQDAGWYTDNGKYEQVDPSFGALSGRLKFTVRRHKFNKDSPSRQHRLLHDWIVQV